MMVQVASVVPKATFSLFENDLLQILCAAQVQFYKWNLNCTNEKLIGKIPDA